MNFIIKKGSHYSNKWLYKLLHFFNLNNKITYEVIFDESCIYPDTKEGFPINKLFGFSNGMHHINSARFGWNSIDGELFIYTYCYINKKQEHQLIQKLTINKTYNLSIEQSSKEYIFTIRDTSGVIIEKSISTKDKSIGYKLWPYFGGSKPSPQQIYIILK